MKPSWSDRAITALAIVITGAILGLQVHAVREESRRLQQMEYELKQRQKDIEKLEEKLYVLGVWATEHSSDLMNRIEGRGQ